MKTIAKQPKETQKQKKGKNKLNPFEVHINRSKHKILGQKSKDDHGLPGISRGKAFRKREKVLLPEYRDRYKDSKFLDLRIGEKNKFLDPEKKILLRIAAEKRRQFSKKSLFNLNEDEQLTHGGEALTDVTMKDQSAFSDDEDDEMLDESFVKDRHFGRGGLFTKPGEVDDGKINQNKSSGTKNRKEWIEEMIAESKQKKAECKREKEFQHDAVSKLNARFQDFLTLMKGRVMTEEDKERSKNTCDFRDYDHSVRGFIFDRSMRAKPIDRLKTEEELARKERESLQKLEEDRQRRMRGEPDNVREDFGTSADALDDEYGVAVMNCAERGKSKEPKPIQVELGKKTKGDEVFKSKFKASEENESGKEEKELSEEEEEEEEEENYETEAATSEEEKIKNEVDEEENYESEPATEVEEEEQENEENEDEIEDKNEVKTSEEDLKCNSEEEDQGSEEEDEKENEENELETEVEGGEDSENKLDEEEENEENDGMEGNDESESNTSEENDDLQNEAEGNEENENEEEEVEVKEKNKRKRHLQQLETSKSASSSSKGELSKTSKTEAKRRSFENELDKMRMSEEAQKELPFIFEVPVEYDVFWDLLQNRTPPQVSTIVERMINCNHPSLGADNDVKANTIFVYILQTLHIICGAEPEILHEDFHPMGYIDPLIPHLYNLTQLSPPDCARSVTQVIDEKYEDYTAQKPRKYPYADTYIFLKISGLLFPASDYHHDVMTRVITFITQLLGEAKVTNGREVVALFFTSSLLFEYLNHSSRFVGELMNALNGVLYLSITSDQLKLSLPHTPPFKRIGPSSKLLVLDKPYKNASPFKLKFSLLNKDDLKISSDFKVCILNETLKLLDTVCHKWVKSPAVRAIFHPTTKLLSRIVRESYPKETNALIDTLQVSISQLPKQLPHLMREETQVKTLRMLMPATEEIVDGMKKRGGSKTFQERQKLMHKLKRERKGARRELKRDAQFLARQQLTEVLASDAERKRKVNIIMQGLAVQESEYQKLKKIKN